MSAPAGRVRLSVVVPAGMGPGRQLRVQSGTRQYDVVIPPASPWRHRLMEVDAPAMPQPQQEEIVPMGLPIEMERAAPPPPATFRRSSTVSMRPIGEAMPRRRPT